MWKFFFIVAFLVLFASTANYLKTGEFWLPAFLQQDDENKPQWQSLSEPSAQKPVYKWFQNGKWIYGSEPPEGLAAETVSVDK